MSCHKAQGYTFPQIVRFAINHEYMSMHVNPHVVRGFHIYKDFWNPEVSGCSYANDLEIFIVSHSQDQFMCQSHRYSDYIISIRLHALVVCEDVIVSKSLFLEQCWVIICQVTGR